MSLVDRLISQAEKGMETKMEIQRQPQQERSAERKKEKATIVRDMAIFSKNMTVTGDVTFGGSLDLMGNVIGNIAVSGKINITGGVCGNSNAAEFYLENASVQGDINSSGNVEIGSGSVVIGNIFAESAVIDGAVEGDIDVCGSVILDTAAVVLGNIRSKSLQINNGALLQGVCSLSYAQIDPAVFFEETERKTEKTAEQTETDAGGA